jgi:hypothetical protein
MATVSTENLLLTLQVDANQALASLKKVNAETKQTQAAFSGAGKNTKQLNAAIQNSSYQIADFAVQVGGGVSAMKAFSQQAPQLLSGFGYIGAAAGAVVAILAAGANSLFNFGETAESATKDLDKFKSALSSLGPSQGPLSELTKALEGASGAMLGFILNLNKLEQGTVAKALDEAQKNLSDYIVELTRYSDTSNNSLLGLSAGIERLKGDTAALEGISEKLNVDASVASEVLALVRAFEAGTASADEFAESLSDLAVAGKVDKEAIKDLENLVITVKNLEAAADSLVPSLNEVVVSVKKLSQADIKKVALSETTDSLERAIKSWDDYVATLERSASAYKDSLDPLRAYNREVNKLGQLLSADLITLDEYNALVEKLRNNLLQPIEVTVKRKKVDKGEDITSLLEELQTEAGRWADQFADTLVSGLADGKLAFKDFADYVLQQLARIAISKALEPLFNSFGNWIGDLAGASAPTGLIATPVNDLPLSREASSAQQMIVGVPRLSTPSPSSSPVTVNVMNYGSDDVEVNERRTSRGIEVDVLIKNAVKSGIAAGDFDKVMATSFGARRLAF